MSTPTPITPATTHAPTLSREGIETGKVEPKNPVFIKHIGAIFHKSLLVPVNLGTKTLKFLGKNLPVFQWIKSLFSSPKSGPVRHSQDFQECLKELHKTTLSTSWDRANKEKAEVRENWTNIRAKITETLPISSTLPTTSNGKTNTTVTLEALLKANNDDTPEQAETSNPEAQTRASNGDETTSLPDASHLLKLISGWKNLETLIDTNLKPLKQSARTDRPLAERLLQKLQNTVKPESIEAELLKNFKTEVLATIKTMIQGQPASSPSDVERTKASKANGELKFFPKMEPSKTQVLTEISTEEIKQANQAPKNPTKTELLTRLSTSIANTHGLSKEQTHPMLDPLIEETLDHPANGSIVIDVLGKPKTLTGEDLKPLKEFARPDELNQGWLNLETLIDANLKTLKQSARAHTKPLAERVLLALLNSLKPESIEALLVKHFEGLIKETITTMIAQAPTHSAPAAKRPSTQKVTGKPPLHPNLKQTQLHAEKASKQIVTPNPELLAKAKEEENELKAMVQETTHQKLRALFAASLPWDKTDRENVILRTVSEKLTKEGKTPQQELIKKLISEALEGVQTQPYELTTRENPQTKKEKFTGSYFKKTFTTSQNTEKRLLPNTLVKGVNGNTYKLLNSLTKQDIRDIEDQHGIPNKEGKTTLGHGGFGKVRFARNLDTNDIVAVKKISTQYHGRTRTPTAPDAAQDLHIPLEIQARIATGREAGYALDGFENSFALFADHATVANRPMRNQISTNRENKPDTFGEKVYIFSELASLGDGETLITRYHDLKNTKPEDAEQLFLNTAINYALAVSRLHSLGFHHRDIKPENFLHSKADGKEQAKLADFGVTEDSSQNKTVGGGSAFFSPPEFLEGAKHPYRSDKHDAFSLGVTLQRIRYNLVLEKFKTEFEAIAKAQGDLGPIMKTQDLPIRLREKTGRVKNITVSFTSEEQVSYKGITDADLQGIDMNNLDMSHLDNIIAKLLISEPTKRMSVAEAYEHLVNLTNIQRNFSALQQ